MLASTWDKNNTCVSFNHIQILSSTNWHCAHQKSHLHLNQRCHYWPNTNEFISLILHNLRIGRLQYSSSQGKKLLQSTPYWSIPPFSNWSIWLLTQTCQCVFTWLCQCHLELERAKGPSYFYLGHFSLSNSFDHITKDASILNPKSSNSHRFSYFSTSTPSRHISHHHGRSIIGHRFLT